MSTGISILIDLIFLVICVVATFIFINTSIMFWLWVALFAGGFFIVFLIGQITDTFDLFDFFD